MKTQEILKMNSEELESKVIMLKQELFDLRFQLALGKLTNTAKVGKLKKTIARIKTILTQQNIVLQASDVKLKPSSKLVLNKPAQKLLHPQVVSIDDQLIPNSSEIDIKKPQEIIKEE